MLRPRGEGEGSGRGGGGRGGGGGGGDVREEGGAFGDGGFGIQYSEPVSTGTQSKLVMFGASPAEKIHNYHELEPNSEVMPSTGHHYHLLDVCCSSYIIMLVKWVNKQNKRARCSDIKKGPSTCVN